MSENTPGRSPPFESFKRENRYAIGYGIIIITEYRYVNDNGKEPV
jgi:hypothetical protein